ncbi:MAG TPA: molybdopterin molybdotransferase MoeA, partial [Croceibacterium sp.]
MTALLPLAEAQARLLALAAPLGSETLPAERCVGRYLAAEVKARRTQPAADLSAMDGYAVTGDGPWRVVGESAAGHPFGGSIARGEALRISTGALMPAGGEAVLLQEEAEREDERLSLAPGGEASARHIRRRGFDFIEGTALLASGVRLGPAQLALAIGAGHGNGLQVGTLPHVSVIDSGDELALSAEQWDDHRLPASNGAMIAAMAAPLASAVERLGPVPDRLDALAQALARAGQADVIVTTGGASVGDHDLVRPALEAWGATIDFWRVAMRPGKPILLARRGRQWILGLPGNPVSSYVTAFLFLLPLLRRLAGAGDCLPRSLVARTDRPLPPGGPRLELVRARLVGSAVLPLDERDSSALRALAAADALIERPIG